MPAQCGCGRSRVRWATTAARLRAPHFRDLSGRRQPHGRRLIDGAIGPRLDLLEADQNHRDVVPAAGAVGFVDQSLSRGVELLGAGQDLGHALLGDHRGQAVAAQQQQIAAAHRVGPGIDIYVRLGPQGPGDDRALRVLGRLFLGQFPASDQLVDERMILSQPRKRAVAKEVGPAVADVGNRELRVVEIRRGERRAHPCPLPLRAGEVKDSPVGLTRAARQPLLDAARVREPLGKRLDGDARSHLAGLRAPHPIGDHEDGRPREHAVLVAAPLTPRVGLGDRVGGAQHRGHCR